MLNLKTRDSSEGIMTYRVGEIKPAIPAIVLLRDAIASNRFATFLSIAPCDADETLPM
jgi:hypothetical protein